MKTATSIPHPTSTTKVPLSTRNTHVLAGQSVAREQLAVALRREEIEEICCGDCGSSIEVLVMKPCQCVGSHGGARVAGR